MGKPLGLTLRVTGAVVPTNKQPLIRGKATSFVARHDM